MPILPGCPHEQRDDNDERQKDQENENDCRRNVHATTVSQNAAAPPWGPSPTTAPRFVTDRHRLESDALHEVLLTDASVERFLWRHEGNLIQVVAQVGGWKKHRCAIAS